MPSLLKDFEELDQLNQLKELHQKPKDSFCNREYLPYLRNGHKKINFRFLTER